MIYKFRFEKNFLILLIGIGVGLAILIGILIYADFSFSIWIKPIVVDERTGIRCGYFWVILEKMQRLLENLSMC